MLFSAAERLIAFRYLRARRKEGFISVIAAFSFLGIMLGVATLIVVMAVMNGFRIEITNKLLGLNGHMHLSSFERGLEGYETLATQLAAIEGITSATPMIDAQVMATGPREQKGVLIKSFSKESLIQKPIIAERIVDGSLENFDEHHILLGAPLARTLGVGVGDEIRLIAPQGNATILGTIPRYKTYYVAAVFNAGMYDFDSNVVIMPLLAAQKLFKLKNRVTHIELFLDHPDHTEQTQQAIWNTLGGMLYRLDSWKEQNHSFLAALDVERSVMFLILTLIVIIAAFNIVASLIMLVRDKASDIAILRTMGASRGSTMRIFFLIGMIIGVIGTLAGVILGTLFATYIEEIRGILQHITGTTLFDPVIYFLSELPAEIELSSVIKAGSVGIICSFVATLYPVWRVSKEQPAQVLRYE